MRKWAAVVVAIVVAASCIPWLRDQRFFSMLVAITAVVLAGLLVLGIVQALARRSSQESQQSMQSGWWSPRLRSLALGAAIILGLMLTAPHFIATSGGAYKLAVATANQKPQFTDALGAPISEA